MPRCGDRGGCQTSRGPAATTRYCCRGDACFAQGKVCLPGVVGECSEWHKPSCAAGQHPADKHEYPEYPSEWDVFASVSRAKMQLLQARWSEAGGAWPLLGAWQVRNRRVDRLFRATAHNLACDLGRTSDVIDGWHGTPEENVYSLAQWGFDTSRRCGQAYGEGEYFAKDPNVSISYARGGSFMFLCKLLLGKEGAHHTWVDSAKYYVVKQRDSFVQALPVFLVQFQPSYGELSGWLAMVQDVQSPSEDGTLQFSQRGGKRACVARKDAGMSAESTQHLWVGWLDPRLAAASDDAVADDVCAFLEGVQVEEVIPERNGARVGAYARLAKPLLRAAFAELAARRYHGKLCISVDDAQRDNPSCNHKPCPRLAGPSGYCRGWNIKGHRAWQWGCPFAHPDKLRPTHGTNYSLEEVAPKSAKYDEIHTALLQSAPFHNGQPRLVSVHRVVNQALEQMYESRRSFLTQKHGFCVEKELWHGTNCKAIPELLTHGLQPPSDTRPSEECPKSGGKGLCTTLCGTDCKLCRDPHAWDKCHMYGLGVYLADMAQKSHRYAREPEWREVDAAGAQVSSGVGASIRGTNGELWGEVVGEAWNCWRLASGRIAKKETEGVRWNWEPQASGGSATAQVYSMLFCRVCLGSPYLIEGNLLGPASLHDVCWCQDPSAQLETVVEDWSLARGHDTFYVRGLSGAQKAGLGVYNSEYIVFQPFQVLPLYRVDYVLE